MLVGKLASTGTGAGKGYTINVPLPGDSGHTSMLAVWQQVIEPAARRFQPDLILCSAGELCLCHGCLRLTVVSSDVKAEALELLQAQQSQHSDCDGLHHGAIVHVL